MKKSALKTWPIWGCAAMLLGGCAGGGSAVLGPTPQSTVSPVDTTSAAPASSSARASAAAPSLHSLAAIHSWAEPSLPLDQKPAATLAALTAQPASLLVVDPAAISAPKAKKSKTNSLSAIQQNGKHKVLALLALATMTQNGPGWNADWTDAKGKLTAKAPSWLEASDGKTPGQYPVQYWNADWQKQVGGELDALVKTGYDGVCLQGVGAFAREAKGHATAAHDMAAWVESLATRARQRDKAFAVVTDAGAALPDALTVGDAKTYYTTIDGIVVRDVFYPGDKPTDNDLLPDAATLTELDDFQKAGLPVFATERLTDPTKIADFLTRARAKGYIPDTALAPPPPASDNPKVADALS